MRILIVGSGGVGGAAALIAADRDFYDLLVLADYDAERADAAALLSFSLSFDDFIITNFVSGDVSTFPKFVYVSYLRGIPAQANVIGFSMFVIAVLLVILGQAIGTRRRR